MQKRKTIFVSGAAENYGAYSQQEVEQFLYNFSQEAMKLGYRIVSGFGLGIGSSVIAGAIKYLLEKGQKISDDDLLLRPFPQDKQGKELWTALRQDMVNHADISIFLFGNKKNADGKIVLSAGMQEEFNLAKEKGNVLIPIAATGYMAKQFWEKDLNQTCDEALKEEMLGLSQEGVPLDFVQSKLLSILEKVKD